MRKVLLTTLIALLPFVNGARADSVLLGTTGAPSFPPFTGVALTSGIGQSVAQQFDLTSQISLTLVSVFAGPTNLCSICIGHLQIHITQSISDTNPLNPLFSSSILLSSGGTQGEWFTVPVNLNLGPGTYFLVITAPDVNTRGVFIPSGSSVLISQVGTIGPFFAASPSSGALVVPNYSLGFELQGNILNPETPVPEPSTLALFLSGTLVTLWRRRRQMTTVSGPWAALR